jgi:hypothetical protein
MSVSTDNPHSTLIQRIQSDISRAEAKISRLGRLNVQLVVGSLGASALATVLAGTAAATGPLMGVGTPAWRWTCGVIAFVTAIAAMLTGAHQRFSIAERLASARSCTSQLRALELRMNIGKGDVEESARRYEELVSQHPEIYG